MKRNLFAAVAALCLSVAAIAQTGPSGPPILPPVNPPAPMAGVLSEPQLDAALKALDPNCKVKPTDDGKGKIYNLTVARDGWKYDLQIESLQNEIWLNAQLSGVVGSPESQSPGVMSELLKANFKIGPAHFAFAPTIDKKGYRLNLCRLLDRRMTAENFNGSMNDFLKVVRELHPTWSQVR
jgi:hypothetical protein